MPRVFVSEYVCGGAWPDGVPSGSLATEGRSMLLAVVSDLLALDDWQISLTWDRRLGPFDFSPLADAGWGTAGWMTAERIAARDLETRARQKLAVIETAGPQDESRAFAALVEECDRAIVIAPEFDGILLGRVQAAGSKCVNGQPDAVALCSDKLALADHLAACGIRTPRTVLLAANTSTMPFDPPFVVKPRYGAGSINIRMIRSESEWESIKESIPEAASPDAWIAQPWADGLACSVAAFIPLDSLRQAEPQRTRIDILPPAVQVLSNDGRCTYLGADLPLPVSPGTLGAIEQFARDVLAAVPALSGYVGMDMVVPDVESDAPVLIEINPRLTTGYLLWRQVTDTSLAARALGLGPAIPLPRHNQSARLRVSDFT